MNKWQVLWVSGLLLAGIPAWCQTLVWSEEAPGYLIQRWTMPQGEITESSVREIAEPVLRRHARKRFVAVQVYSPGSEKCALLTKGYNLGYVGWDALYKYYSALPWEVGEVVAWRRGTVLRVRRKDGGVIRRVLSGADPLRFKFEGWEAEIVFFAFPRPDPLPSPPYRGDSIQLYAILKSRIELDLERCRRFYNALCRSLPFQMTSVAFGPDEWFIGESHFPICYPFGTLTSPPTKEEHFAKKVVACSALRSDQKCGVAKYYGY